jgi:hypothetical protein
MPSLPDEVKSVHHAVAAFWIVQIDLPEMAWRIKPALRS